MRALGLRGVSGFIDWSVPIPKNPAANFNRHFSDMQLSRIKTWKQYLTFNLITSEWNLNIIKRQATYFTVGFNGKDATLFLATANYTKRSSSTVETVTQTFESTIHQTSVCSRFQLRLTASLRSRNTTLIFWVGFSMTLASFMEIYTIFGSDATSCQLRLCGRSTSLTEYQSRYIRPYAQMHRLKENIRKLQYLHGLCTGSSKWQ